MPRKPMKQRELLIVRLFVNPITVEAEDDTR